MLKNKTVMVVEDNATIRRFTASVLKNQLNCTHVLQAASADEALEAIRAIKRRRGPIDLILSDWEMPGMTGDEFLLAVRENMETSDIPFIMVTARNDRDSIIMAAQAGVSEYIVKPFTAGALLQKITRAFQLQERRAMTRFKSIGGDKAEIIFNDTVRYSASVVNVSQTGVLLRSPLFRHAPVCVHDVVNLILKLGADTEISVSAELMRLETDKDNPDNKNLMLAGFQFHELDDKAADKLRVALTKLPELDSKPAGATNGPKVSAFSFEAKSTSPSASEKLAPPPEKKKRLDMDM
ncbi:MAG: response regulator [Nitrospinae bacterium]|nr:response regulator [Nitrospinota bacterium]